RVGKGVFADVGPAYLVGFGEAAPGNAVEIAGTHGDFNVVPRHGDRDHAVFRQEATGGRHAEDAQAVEIGKAADRLVDGEDVQRVPRTGRKVGDVLDLGVGFLPDLVEAVIHEHRRHIEAEARGEREVAAEDGDIDRRGHRGFVGLDRVERAVLQRAEQLGG